MPFGCTSGSSRRRCQSSGQTSLNRRIETGLRSRPAAREQEPLRDEAVHQPEADPAAAHAGGGGDPLAAHGLDGHLPAHARGRVGALRQRRGGRLHVLRERGPVLGGDERRQLALDDRPLARM